MKEPRQQTLQGVTYEFQTGCGPIYVTINHKDTETFNAFEIFLRVGKAGGCAGAQCESIGRLSSHILRIGGSEEDVIMRLVGTHCHQSSSTDDEIGPHSCSHAVAIALKQYKLDKLKWTSNEEFKDLDKRRPQFEDKEDENEGSGDQTTA